MKQGKRRQVYAKTQGKCAYCGCDLDYADMTIDHVKPIVKGGTNEIGNLLPVCECCNHMKGPLSLADFRKDIRASLENALHFWLAVPKSQLKPPKVIFYFEKNTQGKGQSHDQREDETNQTRKNAPRRLMLLSRLRLAIRLITRRIKARRTRKMPSCDDGGS